MKTQIAVIVAVLLGVGAGVGMAVVRAHRYHWDGTANGLGDSIGLPEVPCNRRPKVVVEEDTHDFGVMDGKSKGSYDFVLTNVGEGTLTLKKGTTTCKCAASILGTTEIEPGESGKVTVEWTGKDLAGPFKQTATILTNDPDNRRVRLTIQGRITVALQAKPSELVLPRITAGGDYTAKVRLFAFRPEPLEITDYELVGSSDSKFFEVDLQPMTPDEVEEEQDATSGVAVHVTIKPGLPLGAFRQKILLRTDYEEVPTVAIPVSGTITSGISVVARGWDEDRGVYTLGMVKSQEGVRREIYLRAGGPNHKEVHYKPIQIYPDDLLKVEVGPTRELGKASLTPLKIEIPKGSRPANHMGSDEADFGQITLETGDPETPELRILVRFAVEG